MKAARLCEKLSGRFFVEMQKGHVTYREARGLRLAVQISVWELHLPSDLCQLYIRSKTSASPQCSDSLIASEDNALVPQRPIALEKQAIYRF